MLGRVRYINAETVLGVREEADLYNTVVDARDEVVV
jgi:hypothetical protein